MNDIRQWTRPKFFTLVSALTIAGVFGLAANEVSSSETGQTVVPASPAKAAARSGEADACAALGRAGIVVHIDPQTGRPTTRPSAGQSAAAAAALKAMANRSSTGLVEQPGPAGGVMVNLQGRFRSPVVAQVGSDGKVSVEHARCLQKSKQGDETPAAETNK